MKNGKERVLSAVLTVLGGTGLIFGNHMLASNVLAAGDRMEPPVVISERAGNDMQAYNIVITEKSSGTQLNQSQVHDAGVFYVAEDKGFVTITNGAGDKQELRVDMARNADGSIKFMFANVNVDVQDLNFGQSTDIINVSGIAIAEEQNPIKGKLSEEEATRVAAEAIAEKYGLSQEELGAFDVTIRARYGAPLPANIANMKPAMKVEKMGLFDEADRAPTEEASRLIWSVTFMPVNQADYPTVEAYTAVFDDESLELMNVHAIPLYKEGTPLEGEVSADEAQKIAVTALRDKYAFTPETLNRFTITKKYYEVTPEVPGKHAWWVNLYPTNNDDFSEIGCYWAYIDAETGETLQLNSAVNGKG